MARILVVDDEESVRELLCTVLGQKGHEVLLADGGQKALELYWRRRPQLTILDLYMPDIMGLEVLEKIREQDANAPAIILTGVRQPRGSRNRSNPRCDGFSQKGIFIARTGGSHPAGVGPPPKTDKASDHGP